MMSQTVIDQRQRQQAINPQKSFIVQAPAGSGKTALLVQRILALLAQVDEPEEILAITFTRKAASEMRERIIDALNGANLPNKLDGDYQRVTRQLAQAVLQRDEMLDWGLLTNPTRLRVQTIDSLCASLVRQMPLLSNFGAIPAIAEDSLQLYKKAARNTIGELESNTDWSDSIEHLVSHLDNRLDYLQNLICNMLAKRDQWLRHVADPDHPSIDRESLENALARLMQSMVDVLKDDWPTESNTDVLKCLSYAIKQLNEARELAGEEPECIIDDFPGYVLTDLHSWKNIAELLLTKEGQLRKSINKRQGFPPKSAFSTDVEKNLAEVMKQEMMGLLESFSAHPRALENLQAIRSLPSPLYTEDEWQTMQALFELLRLSAAQLELVFSDMGQVDYTAMSRAANHALGEAQQPTDLALSLDYKISHILVDEFQDTSQSQFELLKRLTSGWQMGDQKTLFLVGDPMQSIYRFREAEVGLFLEAWESGVGDVKLEAVNLQVNFRSQQGIIDWVNQCFNVIMPEKNNMETGAVSYTDSVAFHQCLQTEACVIHPYFDKDEIEEAQQIIRIIEKSKAENPSGNIAILVRGRTHLYEIVQRLKKASLTFRAVEIEALSHRPVIQDLLALVKALSHAADNIAWLGLLRAPWCGLTLSDIHLISSYDKKSNIIESILNPECTITLSKEGQLRLKRTSDVLNKALDNVYRKNMRDWIEGTWCSLGGPACLQDPTDLEDAEVFFQLLEKLDNIPLQERNTELARSVGKLFALPDVTADESLQIMTIHKSKGLEFDTVILPGLGYRPSSSDSDLMKWFERPRQPDQNDLLMAPIKQTGSQINHKYQLLSDFEKQKGLYENSRLLYVAATRAKKQLHVLGHVNGKVTKNGMQMQAPTSGSLLSNLWPFVEHQFKIAFETCQKNIPADAENNILQAKEKSLSNGLARLPLDWALPDAPKSILLASQSLNLEEEVIEFDWAGETARNIGTVVHALLQYISQLSQDNISSYAARLEAKCQHLLIQQGVARDDLTYAIDRVLGSIQNCLKDDRGQWILSQRHQNAQSEYALTGLVNKELKHIIIDRTFVDNDVRWIIDYKTGAHTGAGIDEYLEREVQRYQSQLQQYAEIISQVDDRPIKLGLYFPLMQKWREWSFLN